MNDVQKTDKTLIETVTFLSGLVSETKTLDALSGKLKSIVVAGQSPDTPLTSEERNTLYDLREQLQEYLIQKDPLRSFTPKTLERTVEGHIKNNGGGWQKGARGVGTLLLVLAASYGLGLLAFTGSSTGERLLLAVPFPIMLLYAVIVWFFWSGVNNFKARLRRAYVWISTGILLTGIGATQGPVLLAVPSLAQNPWLAYNGSIFIFTLSCLFIYVGLRIFALHLGKSSLASSLLLVIGATVAISVVVPMIPHSIDIAVEWAYDFAIVSSLLCSLYGGLGAYFAKQVADEVTAPYAKAMRWFSATMALVAVNTIYVAGFFYFSGPISENQLTFISAPFIVSGILMFVSGYEFKKGSGNV